jgi:hypothetical protein
VKEWLALGPLALGVCAAALFAGGLAKGAVGIGLPLVSAPLIAIFVSVPKALALVLGIGLGTQLLVNLDEGTLYLVIGLMVFTYPVLSLADPRLRVPSGRSPGLGQWSACSPAWWGAYRDFSVLR